jgi:hypothetical protein
MVRSGVASQLCLIVTANWTSNPARQWFYWAAVALIGGPTAVAFARGRSIKIRMTGVWRSLRMVCAALMLAALALAIAAKMHTLQQPYGPMVRAEALAGYVVWAIAQQWLPQGYF